MKLQHVLAASAAFAASVWSGYEYAKPLKTLPAADEHGGSSAAGEGAFDRLAPVYDAVVGREEQYMFYGLMRWWLVSKAKGDVLEMSAGTGRNLEHYSYSSVHSLTLSDVSAPMLQRAQAKFFDELQLQYKQPQLAVKFVLADAEHMVAADGQTPAIVQLPPARVLRPGVRSAGAPAAAAAAAGNVPEQQRPDAAGSSIWRFKNKQHSSSSFAAGAATADGTATSSSSSSSVDDSRRTGNDTDGGSSNSSSSSGSSTGNGWRWRRQQQQQESEPDAGCTASGCSRSHSAAASSSEQLSTFAPGSFDTVVDTFGLCSCRDPVQALRQAALLLKPGGQLLLLEHGRSSWAFLNRHMDERAPSHYRTYGCWYNRDIMDVVQQAGLQVQSAWRWHFGTSYMIVATAPADQGKG